MVVIRLESPAAFSPLRLFSAQRLMMDGPAMRWLQATGLPLASSPAEMRS